MWCLSYALDMSNTRWEYKVIPVTDIFDKKVSHKRGGLLGGYGELECGPFEAWLNEMGQQGWELVESNPTPVNNGAVLKTNPLTYLVLKRPLV